MKVLTDDEFLTGARTLTERYIRERLDRGQKIGLDVDADGRLIKSDIQLRMARANDEWIVIAEDWPEGCASHHADETVAQMMTLNAVYRTIREMYERVRIARYPCQTLKFNTAERVRDLLRTN